MKNVARLLFVLLLSSIMAQAEYKRLEITVFGMD